MNQNEFFNRRVGKIYYTGAPTPGGVNETPVSRIPDAGARGLRGGVFVLPTDGVVVAPYALLDGSITPDGVVVARDEELGTTLWRLTGPLSSRTTVTGIYDDGSWSGRTATWQLLRCRPGTLTTAVHSDPSLFTTGPDRRRHQRQSQGGRALRPRRARVVLDPVSRPTSGERASFASSSRRRPTPPR